MQDSCLQWQSERAAGGWFDVITESLSTLHDENILRTFLTCDASGSSLALGENDNKEQWLIEESQSLQGYFDMIVELASARAWSQMLFTTCLPHAFVGAGHKSKQVATQLMKHQKRIWEAVLAAEQLLLQRDYPKKPKASLNALMIDLAWNQIHIAREIFVVCSKNNWSVDAREVKEFVQRLFGAPFNTKFDLEDLFAHLASLSKMTTLATPMGKSNS